MTPKNTLLLSALLLAGACNDSNPASESEAESSEAATESTPAQPPAQEPAETDDPPEAPEAGTPGDEETAPLGGEDDLDNEHDVEESTEAEEELAEEEPVVVPGYAAEAPPCVPHDATTDGPSLRELARGQVENPLALALDPACDHAAAELADALNTGGLVRHRRGEYDVSLKYFQRAVIADPSQLSPRFNIACALARLSDDTAFDQLDELRNAGPEGADYAERATRDRDFSAYRNDPELFGFYQGVPPAVEEISGESTYVVETEPPLDFESIPTGSTAWETGLINSGNFATIMREIDPDRRRYQFFRLRTSDESRATLRELGFVPLQFGIGWMPVPTWFYGLIPTSSRDDDEHSMYIVGHNFGDGYPVFREVDLPAASECSSDAMSIRTFVASRDHRAVGYIVGCADESSDTYERCLFYQERGEFLQTRCGQVAAMAEGESDSE